MNTLILTILAVIRVSILTCAPGEELYARFGHTAIRVEEINDAGEKEMDYVFNYGQFSFQQPNFYGRFLKGETMYCLGVERYSDFEQYYRSVHRKVYSQYLNLTDQQAWMIQQRLLINALPENREYLYNFVYDNCATRPYRLIEPYITDSLRPTEQHPTWRDLIHRCVGEYSVIGFGIDLLLGDEADQVGDSLFLPECVMNRLEPLSIVGEQEVGRFAPVHIAWYNDIRFWLGLLAITLILQTLHDRQRHKLTKQIDIVLIVSYVLALMLVAYLTFCSLHPLVGFGYRLLIIPAIHLCSRLLYFLPSQH